METCHLLFVGLLVCWSHCQRNQQSLAPGVLYTGRQNGTKFDPLIGQALLYIISKIYELWPKGSWGAKIQSLQEFFVRPFFYIVRPSAMKFGAMMVIGL